MASSEWRILNSAVSPLFAIRYSPSLEGTRTNGPEAGVDPCPETADHAGSGADADQAAGADHRQRAHHACFLSGVSAGPECRRRAGVAEGKPGPVLIWVPVIEAHIAGFRSSPLGGFSPVADRPGN